MKVKFLKMEKFPVRSQMIFIGNMVRAYHPIDRTGLLNDYNMMYEPIPKDFTNFDKSFEEVAMSRAEQLWKIGKPIELFWSGGIDSSVALVALMETKKSYNEIKIRYTEDSIEEFPTMWEKIVKKINDPLPHIKILSTSVFNDHSVTKVTGQCGDQCFGSMARKDIIQEPWESIYKFGHEKLFSVLNHEGIDFELEKRKLMDYLFYNLDDTCPIPIKTIFDLYWWLNFCFKWQDVVNVMNIHNGGSNEWRSTEHYFNTQDFQKWSLVNHDLKIQYDWKSYKQPAKDFINKYVKDDSYCKNKTKEASLIKVLEKDVPLDAPLEPVSTSGEITYSRYNYKFRKKKRTNPDSFAIVFEDSSFYRMKDDIPEEVIKEITL